MAKILVDTQSIIWAAENSNNLSEKVKSIFEENKDDFFVSVGSIWEMSIKISIGKLDLSFSLEKLLENLMNENYKLLSITAQHTLQVRDLVLHHKDPFDRIIISQAIVENLVVISSDEIFDAYPIKRIW